MVREIALLLATTLAGCTVARMEGFDAIAARSDRLDVIGMPAWMNGDFRLGTAGTRGHVRRKALGETRGDGVEVFGTRYDRDRVVRYGQVDFEVAGPDVDGALAAACRYDRAELREGSGAVTTSAPTVPLLYRCRFSRDGQPVGDLTLEAAEKHDQPFVSARAGRVRLAGVELGIRSVHDIVGLRTAADTRMGYVFDGAAGPVGAIETNGATARLAVPRASAERRAAIAAALALALFWDPGDTDD